MKKIEANRDQALITLGGLIKKGSLKISEGFESNDSDLGDIQSLPYVEFGKIRVWYVKL